MKRWNTKASERIENLKVDAFIEEVISVCGKHGYSISHEDGHGSFEIESLNKNNLDWLREASDKT